MPASDAAPPEPSPHEHAPRRVWVSGGTGFIGLAVIRMLRGRGDEVVAPVRNRNRATALVDLGVTVVEDHLVDVNAIADQLHEVDAVIHAAGSYRVGIRREERGAVWDGNIGLTTRVLDAAEKARTRRIVYVSTINVFGDTHGNVVDEAYRRDLREGFLSWYDETKYGAHEVVEQRIRSGAPIVIVLPSQVYGPGDRSAVGEQLRRAYQGTLRFRALDDVAFGFVHVDDLAAGIVVALDRGETGAAYAMSGPRHALGEAIATAARVGGKAPPAMAVPTTLIRAAASVARRLGNPGLTEIVSAGAGVTYWASSARAEAELGFRPRSLEDGLKDTFEAEAEAAYTRR